jgi:hypothetical protein
MLPSHPRGKLSSTPDRCYNYNMITCINCQKETPNPKFCSRSCAASMNNRISPKRKADNRCQACNVSVGHRRKYCKECRKKGCIKTKRGILSTDITLRDAIYINLHKSSAFALVRHRARSIAKNLGMSACAICGYKKHVEISHKKPIAEFDLDTPISIINAKENIWPLCPNCHWEYDHGLIQVPLAGLEPA